MPLITKTSEILEDWERHTQNLAEHFVKRYFNDPSDIYWIGDDVGGCLSINDYFFSLSDMVDYLKYRYSKEKMFARYDYSIDPKNYLTPINIQNWIKLRKGDRTQKPIHRPKDKINQAILNGATKPPVHTCGQPTPQEIADEMAAEGAFGKFFAPEGTTPHHAEK